jgi:nitroreductase/dihydropteridine reductase
MRLIELLKERHTAKAFDATYKLSPEQLTELCAVLRLAPSSCNNQPWHFFLLSSPEGKEKILPAVSGKYIFNRDKVKNASLAVVLCSKLALSDEDLKVRIDQEDADGRYATPEFKANGEAGRLSFMKLHRDERHDETAWHERQVYIALGFLLMGAAKMGLDACALEGFDADLADQELGLTQKGLKAQVVVAIGRRSADDFNAALPKSRLPEETVITHI